MLGRPLVIEADSSSSGDEMMEEGESSEMGAQGSGMTVGERVIANARAAAHRLPTRTQSPGVAPLTILNIPRETLLMGVEVRDECERRILNMPSRDWPAIEEAVWAKGWHAVNEKLKAEGIEEVVIRKVK
nr:MAG: hypothetical protein [Trichoderma harzianum orthocurvulavirus 1]